MELTTADFYKQLSTTQVADLLGISKATVWNYVNDGLIPEPRYPRPRVPKWKLGEVIEAYEAHLAETNIKATGVKASGAKSSKVLQPVVEEKKHKKKLTQSKESIGQKLKDRFGIG